MNANPSLAMPLERNNRYLLAIFALALVASINIAWAHQNAILHAITVPNYYDFAARKPFIYRVLLPLIYGALFGFRNVIYTDLKHPVSSSYEIFQLVADSLAIFSLFIAMFMLFDMFNKQHAKNTNALVALLFWLIVLIFGYFIVPNRTYFYPYDFIELSMLALTMLAITRAERSLIYLLPALLFFASLNKETAGFVLTFYVIHHYGRRSIREMLATLILSVAACMLARYFVFFFLTSMDIAGLAVRNQFEIRLIHNLGQLFGNPLAWFSMLGIMSYTYIFPILLRRHLDRRDRFLLLAVLLWTAIMFVVGEIRELRIFAPMSLFIFILFSKHFRALREEFGTGGKPAA